MATDAARFRALTRITVDKIEAARFAPGDRVQVVSLDAVPEWIGRHGTVIEVRSGGPWPVVVDLDTTRTDAGAVERLGGASSFAGSQLVKIEGPNGPWPYDEITDDDRKETR